MTGVPLVPQSSPATMLGFAAVNPYAVSALSWREPTEKLAVSPNANIVTEVDVLKFAPPSRVDSSPGAMHLRTLQTMNDLSSDQSNTIVFALPVEIMRHFSK